MAKCDFCSQRKLPILQSCVRCKMTICKACCELKHAGGSIRAAAAARRSNEDGAHRSGDLERWVRFAVEQNHLLDPSTVNWKVPEKANSTRRAAGSSSKARSKATARRTRGAGSRRRGVRSARAQGTASPSLPTESPLRSRISSHVPDRGPQGGADVDVGREPSVYHELPPRLARLPVTGAAGPASPFPSDATEAAATLTGWTSALPFHGHSNVAACEDLDEAFLSLHRPSRPQVLSLPPLSSIVSDWPTGETMTRGSAGAVAGPWTPPPPQQQQQQSQDAPSKAVGAQWAMPSLPSFASSPTHQVMGYPPGLPCTSEWPALSHAGSTRGFSPSFPPPPLPFLTAQHTPRFDDMSPLLRPPADMEKLEALSPARPPHAPLPPYVHGTRSRTASPPAPHARHGQPPLQPHRRSHAALLASATTSIRPLGSSLEQNALRLWESHPHMPLDHCLRHEVERCWSEDAERLAAVAAADDADADVNDNQDGSGDYGDDYGETPRLYIAAQSARRAFYVLLAATYYASTRLNLSIMNNAARRWLSENEQRLAELGA